MEINSTKRISLNIATTIIQVFVVGIIYFLLYRFLVEKLGVEKLGVWSIILATSSIANIANFGITSGLVKFVAEYNSQKNDNVIEKLIFTGFLSVLMLFIIIIVLIYFFSRKILIYIIDDSFLNLALDILPYSLICLLVNSIGGIFTSTLEGYQKNYIKNSIYLISSILFLITTYYLVPFYDLLGVAYSQVIQSFFILILSFLFVIKETNKLIFNKWHWDTKIFISLIKYGSKFQIISIFQLFYEPITKSLISKFGGLAFLGYYEMAARLVNQFRSLIVNANQVIVPVIAHTNSVDKNEINNIYKKSLLVVFFISICLFSFVILFTPLISKVWIGFVEHTFVFTSIILSVSMFINILIGPAYFSCVGEGNLDLVLKSQIIMGVLNLFFGYFFGYFVGGYGVIIGWSIAITFSSVYLYYHFHNKKKIPLKIVYTIENLKAIVLFVILLVFGNLVF